MTLGQRLKQARLEAGLSQRQLCGDTITRNMLSQIENGAARPSMDTLAYLAAQLGKSVSFFLEEDAVLSPNQAVMEAARQALQWEDYGPGLDALAGYRGPDPVFDWEKGLLEAVLAMNLAQKMLEADRRPYAVTLLDRAEQAGQQTPYFGPEHRRRWALLLAKAQPEGLGQILAALPPMDEELLLRSRAALSQGAAAEAAALLEAAADKGDPHWNLLRGAAAFALGQHEEAAKHLHQAEEAFPEQAVPLLEGCYQALEDYKMAYVYACKQKSKNPG